MKKQCRSATAREGPHIRQAFRSAACTTAAAALKETAWPWAGAETMTAVTRKGEGPIPPCDEIVAIL